MENNPVEKKSDGVYVVDFLRILKCLWKKAWLLAAISILAAVLSFSYAFFFVSPMYSSSVKLYVNNSSVSLGNSKISISSADISASQSLIKTYIAILQSRSTLEMVIDRSDVELTTNRLSSMITATSVNDTEIMKVTVTGGDPDQACRIANVIAEVLPERISEIIDGSSTVVVDRAIATRLKVSPSFTKFALVGFLAGFVLCAAVIIGIDSLDDTIHDDDYIVNRYDCPILGKVQNLNISGSKAYKYNYYYGRSGSKSGNGNQ